MDASDFPKNSLHTHLAKVLKADKRVIFAYLYGSALQDDQPNDIDIAVYVHNDVEPYLLSADLKIALSKETGLSPDGFDIRILNSVAEFGDLFALLYLKNVLKDNCLLLDTHPELRSDFLERFSMKYRECEGLFQEVLV